MADLDHFDKKAASVEHRQALRALLESAIDPATWATLTTGTGKRTINHYTM